MSVHKQVALLLRKVSQDEYVLDALLDDSDAPVEVFGFHAQQAAEKLLKALLVSHGVEYPLTHRLVELIDLGRDRGVPIPTEFDDLRDLTPFAVEFRYDVFPFETEEPIEKSVIRMRIRSLRAWVEEDIQRRSA